MTLTTPTVHLNGTSREDLSDHYEAAYRAMNDAIDAVCGASPNARDYYVQADGAFTRAVSEQESRLQRLRDVRDELLALYEAVQG